MLKIFAAFVTSGFVSTAFGVDLFISVDCLDAATRVPYGVTGRLIKIERGALINFVDLQGNQKQIDLKKGECELKLDFIPDEYP